MPRPRLPARLYYDEKDQVWCIRDGTHKKRTGCRRGDREEAENQLESYLASKRSEEKIVKGRRAASIPCAEVLAYYGSESPVSRPGELGQRLGVLLKFWGTKTLDDINKANCNAFAKKVKSDSYARRCLEDFRAAVNEYKREGFLREEITFTLPPKPLPREDWLTKEEVEALCETARTYREVQRGVQTNRYPTRHIETFIRVAVETATRSSRVYRATYKAMPERPHLDLEARLFRRSWPGERVASNKRAPNIPLGDRLVNFLRRKIEEGELEVCPGGGDCKKAFTVTVDRARKRCPHLFKRDEDGTPKEIVRHTLRHTAITWMAIEGIDAHQVCKWAGISMQVFEDVYAHHNPKYMQGILDAQRDNEPEEAPSADRNGQKPQKRTEIEAKTRPENARNELFLNR
jgi:integrase